MGLLGLILWCETQGLTQGSPRTTLRPMKNPHSLLMWALEELPDWVWGSFGVFLMALYIALLSYIW